MNFKDVYHLELKIKNHVLEVEYQKRKTKSFDLLDILPSCIYGEQFKRKTINLLASDVKDVKLTDYGVHLFMNYNKDYIFPSNQWDLLFSFYEQYNDTFSSNNKITIGNYHLENEEDLREFKETVKVSYGSQCLLEDISLMKQIYKERERTLSYKGKKNQDTNPAVTLTNFYPVYFPVKKEKIKEDKELYKIFRLARPYNIKFVLIDGKFQNTEEIKL